MSVSYFYAPSRLPGSAPATAPGSSGPSLSPPHGPSIQPLRDVSNPIFNFPQDFIDKYHKVSATDMGSAQPYISICSMDLNGAVITDFNDTYFRKTLDFAAVNSKNRYADRPIMSLESIEIRTDLAPGAGFMSHSEVSINIKLHKPAGVLNQELRSLLCVGMPMRIIYGWNSVFNDFLDIKDIIIFNLREYTLGFDASGQANLTIAGTSHTENFANVFIGDAVVSTDDVTNTPGDQPISNVDQDGVTRAQKATQVFVSYENVQKAQDDSGGRDFKVTSHQAQTYKKLLDRVAKQVMKNYKGLHDQLTATKTSRTDCFSDLTRRTKSGESQHAECVTVHDVVSILCGTTLDSLQGSIVPANKDFRVAYGCFNQNCGSAFSGTSISAFPIHWRSFLAELRTLRESGFKVPTLQAIFNILTNAFLNNEGYWREHLVKDTAELSIPLVTFDLGTHLLGTQEILQMSITDAKQDVPLTQAKLRAANLEKASQTDWENAVVGNTGIPVIRFGHANSFIKSVTMNHQNDPYMRAYLISRGEANSVNTSRDFVTMNSQVPLAQQHALFLPLKGEMEVLGHVYWKTSRFFYLSSGVYFIDGIYMITHTEHTLKSSGFSTRLQFTMH